MPLRLPPTSPTSADSFRPSIKMEPSRSTRLLPAKVNVCWTQPIYQYKTTWWVSHPIENKSNWIISQGGFANSACQNTAQGVVVTFSGSVFAFYVIVFFSVNGAWLSPTCESQLKCAGSGDHSWKCFGVFCWSKRICIHSLEQDAWLTLISTQTNRANFYSQTWILPEGNGIFLSLCPKGTTPATPAEGNKKNKTL